MTAPKRILIIKPSSLGDVAATLPVLCDLRRAFPGAEIDWLIHPAFVGLVEGHDAIAGGRGELVAFDRKKLGAWWWRPSAFGLFWRLLRKLRGKRYDVVIDAQGLFRSGFLGRVTGARVRVGFAQAREGAAWMYTNPVKLPEGGKKMVAVDRMRALLGPLGVDVSGPAEFRMPVWGVAAEKMGGLLAEAGLEAGRPYVAIIPGARWNTKRWDIERYTEVAGKLANGGEFVVLLGSPDERPLCDQIERSISSAADGAGGVMNLAGVTSLREMIAVLSRARLVIGNDSGPLHVAVALGRRTISIYGPTSPEFVGPYGQLENVIRHDVICHPCRRRECDHHSCMKGVTVELVWEKARGMLREKAGRKP